MSCLDGHCGELVINDNFITEESKSVIAMVGKNKEVYCQRLYRIESMVGWVISFTQMVSKAK